MRHQIRIHVHGNKIFLPEQSDGWIIINHDTDIHDLTTICGKIKLKDKAHNG